MIALELDVNAVRMSHLKWELALEGLLAGHAIDDSLQGHEDCELGTWIYGTGIKKYGKLSAIWQLKTTHKHFHEVSKKTITLVRCGQLEQAREVQKQVRGLSCEILFLLTSLELDVVAEVMRHHRPRTLMSFLPSQLFSRRHPIKMLSIRGSASDPQPRHRLNVTGARLAHLQWIRDLQNYFRLHHKQPTILPSDECSLGVWIHGSAMREMGQTPNLIELDRVHKQFHLAADQVLQALNQHKFARADQIYEDTLEYSGEIIRILTVLQLEASQPDLLYAQESSL